MFVVTTCLPLLQVLDLDETLVHCSVEPIPGADLTFPVDFNGTNYTVFVRKRPHLARFLEAVYDKFEVVIFTASQVRAYMYCVCMLCACVCAVCEYVCVSASVCMRLCVRLCCVYRYVMCVRLVLCEYDCVRACVLRCCV